VWTKNNHYSKNYGYDHKFLLREAKLIKARQKFLTKIAFDEEKMLHGHVQCTSGINKKIQKEDMLNVG